MAVGCVDFTISNNQDNINDAEKIAEWLNEHGIKNIRVAKTGKSTSLRAHVPPIDFKTGFDNIPEADLVACIDAVQAFSDFADILSRVRKMKNYTD